MAENRLLVVDDDIDLCHYIADVATGQGFEVAIANSDQELIDTFESFKALCNAFSSFPTASAVLASIEPTATACTAHDAHLAQSSIDSGAGGASDAETVLILPSSRFFVDAAAPFLRAA